MYFTTLTTLLPALLLLTPTSATPMEPIHTITLLPTLPPTNSTSNSATTLAPRDQNIGRVAKKLTIKFYTAPACAVSIVSLFNHIIYNTQMYGRAASFTLSRDLLPKEVLDFSTGSGVDPSIFGMQEAVDAGGAQYPGPGYKDGGFLVPSACDSFFWSAPVQAKAKMRGGSACYTPPKDFNCVRLWMQS